MENTLLGVLVGGGIALIASLITAVVSRGNTVEKLKHRTEEEKRIHRRNRVDHLHASACAYSIEIRKYRFFLLNFISKSREDKNLAEKEYWEWFGRLADPLSEINSVARLYLPEIMNELSDLLNQTQNVINAATDLFFERVGYNEIEKELSLQEMKIRLLLNAVDANGRALTGAEIKPKNKISEV
jgi:hypothetical protein